MIKELAELGVDVGRAHSEIKTEGDGVIADDLLTSFRAFAASVPSRPEIERIVWSLLLAGQAMYGDGKSAIQSDIIKRWNDAVDQADRVFGIVPLVAAKNNSPAGGATDEKRV